MGQGRMGHGTVPRTSHHILGLVDMGRAGHQTICGTDGDEQIKYSGTHRLSTGESTHPSGMGQTHGTDQA